MADPVTWAIIAGVATAGAAAHQADTANKQGKAAEDLAVHNAEVQRQKGKAAAMASREEARQHRFASREALASTRARIGAVESDDTTLGLLERQAVNAELDNLMILREGQLTQNQFLEASDIERLKDRQARAVGKREAIGSILSGAARVASMGVNFK